tara:strand:+ start:435231 stop:435815 length:585 start_codon:yes stop_codon:yes gene_type:complete
MGMLDFLKEKVVSGFVKDSFDEIKKEAGKLGLEVNIEGQEDVAEFAVQVNNDIEAQDKEIQMRVGTSLSETFSKAIVFSMTAAALDNTEVKLKEANEQGDEAKIDELGELKDTLEDELEDMEEDILDDYRNLEGNLDLEAVHVQRNHDGNGNLSSVEVTVGIENTNNGEELEMTTEIELDQSKNINKVNVNFDI